MKETTEFFIAGFASLNAYAEATKDREINGDDLQYVLPLVFKWQAGIKDLTFAQEAAKATPPSIEQMFTAAGQELTSANITPEFRYAAKEIVKGHYTTYWMTSKTAFNAGKEQAEEALLREIEAKGAPAVVARLKGQNK